METISLSARDAVSCPMTRRGFLAAATAAVAAADAQSEAGATLGPPSRPPVCVFSKHLQFLDYARLADACAALGVDGVDLTVRPGGHVLPENAARDLPRAVEALNLAGVGVPMITTRMNDGEDPLAAIVLSTAGSLGIRYVRVGNHRYLDSANPWDQLAKVIADLRGIAALAEEHAMVAGYHNHSGYGNVGAPLWDLHHVLREVGSAHVGSNFDAGHATVEGGYGAWEINTRLMAPYIKMMAVKDFLWEGDQPRWVALGEGNVKLARILEIVRAAGFSGPISMHFEYAIPSNDAMLEHIRAAASVLRAALTTAGYT